MHAYLLTWAHNLVSQSQAPVEESLFPVIVPQRSLLKAVMGLKMELQQTAFELSQASNSLETNMFTKKFSYFFQCQGTGIYIL